MNKMQRIEVNAGSFNNDAYKLKGETTYCMSTEIMAV
jgi:hypothetical protein